MLHSEEKKSDYSNVAVVILNWNGSEMLRQFLPSVIEHSSNARIIVADNGSKDDSLTVLKNEFPEVERIVFNRNWGFADGYNKALAEVNSDVFVLLNSDVEVTPNWIQPIVDFMRENPNTAACQPKLLSYKSKQEFEYAGASGGFIDKYGYPYCRGRIFDTVEVDTGQYDSIIPIFWASGAAMFIRAIDYKAVGGLDGRFFAHMEEIDLCWRLKSMGREIYVIPQSTVYHVGGATLAKGNPNKTYLNFRNNLFMLYKNVPKNELASVLRMRSMLDYIAAFKFLLSGDMGNFKAVMKAKKVFAKQKREFDDSRLRCQQKRKVNNIAECADFSIIWNYYVKQKKQFSRLH